MIDIVAGEYIVPARGVAVAVVGDEAAAALGAAFMMGDGGCGDIFEHIGPMADAIAKVDIFLPVDEDRVEAAHRREVSGAHREAGAGDGPEAAIVPYQRGIGGFIDIDGIAKRRLAGKDHAHALEATVGVEQFGLRPLDFRIGERGEQRLHPAGLHFGIIVEEDDPRAL